jgi:hypothetical protein
MERFDQDGKLVVPDRAALEHELKKHGIETGGALRIHQAFCPNGHQLILRENVAFDNLPGIKLLLSGARGAEPIYISPVLNKRQRSGGAIFRVGDRLEVHCPVCSVQLPVLAPCDCQWNGEYVMLSLDEDPATRNAICFCNIWGCPNGDIRLAGEVIAEYQRNYEL